MRLAQPHEPPACWACCERGHPVVGWLGLGPPYAFSAVPLRAIACGCLGLGHMKGDLKRGSLDSRIKSLKGSRGEEEESGGGGRSQGGNCVSRAQGTGKSTAGRKPRCVSGRGQGRWGLEGHSPPSGPQRFQAGVCHIPVGSEMFPS